MIRRSALAVLVVAPLAFLVVFGFDASALAELDGGRLARIALTTFLYAAGVALLTGVLGPLFAWLLQRAAFPGRRLLEATLDVSSRVTGGALVHGALRPRRPAHDGPGRDDRRDDRGVPAVGARALCSKQSFASTARSKKPRASAVRARCAPSSRSAGRSYGASGG